MDMNRNQRKISSREERRNFSQQSILSSMDRFVQAVENMNATVMVPSRLLDMNFGEESILSPGTTIATNHNNKNTSKAVSYVANSKDLYRFYGMLNMVQTELLWGASTNKEYSEPTQTQTQQPVRRLSSISNNSLVSMSDDSEESESCGESDSGLEEVDDSAKIAYHFKKHLSGLSKMLEQLTDSANFLTNRYQTEVVGAS